MRRSQRIILLVAMGLITPLVSMAQQSEGNWRATEERVELTPVGDQSDREPAALKPVAPPSSSEQQPFLARPTVRTAPQEGYIFDVEGERE
ncbi:MAG: hypothetical protein KDD43_13860 [Bdellovibrionales bacterium]|nr:hypothetical protein [Bdellovibrionales bacterium]